MTDSSQVPLLTIAICTHNPQTQLLQRVIDHLKAQTLPVARWEFLLIDNASEPAVEASELITWHPSARVVRENQVGLTWARYRAFREATAPWIVFVDDDNLLNPDYLANCARRIASFPQLGIFGSTWIQPEFEMEPESWMKPFLPFLALRESGDEAWSNQPEFNAFPCGAAMAIRRDTGLDYYERIHDADAMDLGRKGKNMNSGDDTALVLAVLEAGHGTGVFPDLRLIHVIPEARLERQYLERLATGISRSLTRLKLDLGLQPRSLVSRFKALISGIFQILRNRRQWQFQWCILKGELQAWRNQTRS